MSTKIDLEQLRKEIRRLKRTQSLYRILKEELSRIGYWKNQARGNPEKAYRARGKK